MEQVGQGQDDWLWVELSDGAEQLGKAASQSGGAQIKHKDRMRKKEWLEGILAARVVSLNPREVCQTALKNPEKFWGLNFS